MSGSKKRIWIPKGEYGYFKSEKLRRFLITAVLLGIPLAVFAAAWKITGTRGSIWTVAAAVGCIPGCKSTVTLILLLRQKSLDASLYESIRAHEGGLVMAYELYMTFYEKSAFIDALAVCGNTVVGYSSDPKMDKDFMADKAQKMIRKNGFKADVKILTDLRLFLERLDSMDAHRDSLREGLKFTPDPRYPDYTRDEMLRHVILRLCV